MAGKWEKLSRNCQQIPGLPFKYCTRPRRGPNVFLNPETKSPYIATCLNPKTKEEVPLISVLCSTPPSSLSSQESFPSPPSTPPQTFNRSSKRHHPYAKPDHDKEEEEEEARVEREIYNLLSEEGRAFYDQSKEEEEEFLQSRNLRRQQTTDPKQLMTLLQNYVSKVVQNSKQNQ